MNKILILKILFLPSVVINFLNLKFRKVSYCEFPDIKGTLIIRGKGTINFGKKIKINSSFAINPLGLTDKCAIYSVKDAKIIIGNHVGISNSLLYAMEKIEIEDHVLIGGGCQILDNDFHPLEYDHRISNNNVHIRKKAIMIKEGAFIGASSIILKGVTVGRRSVVGAGSVVTKDIPDFEIWAGNPAVFVKKIPH